MSKILENLFLGSEDDIKINSEITYYINVTRDLPKPLFVKDENFFRCPVNDGFDENISSFFPEIFKIIEERNKDVFLVYCKAGISRSPTIVISYLMKKFNMKSQDAYDLVKEKRPCISPNLHFIGQLYCYEKKLFH